MQNRETEFRPYLSVRMAMQIHKTLVFIYIYAHYLRHACSNVEITGAVLGRQNTSSEQPPTQYGRH